MVRHMTTKKKDLKSLSIGRRGRGDDECKYVRSSN